MSNPLREIDGSRGEGGGQILRTALCLSMVTGRPFRLVNIRANRPKPGLRPQHLAAVEAAAALCQAQVEGVDVGARTLTFRPRDLCVADLERDIGTAGSTALVLQTLYLPIALHATRPVRVALAGGTFNTHAPSFPFLDQTWRCYLRMMGLHLELSMPLAGFFPVGGGRLEASIEPGRPSALSLPLRGPLLRLFGEAGVANLPRGAIAERMRDTACLLLAERGLDAEIECVAWPSRGQGAAISLTAEFGPAGAHPATRATFVGLGQRGKPAERVAAEAVGELFEYLDAPGVVDRYSADQIMLPLCLAEGPSRYTVTLVTEHLRTNLETIRTFLHRSISLEESAGGTVVTIT